MSYKKHDGLPILLNVTAVAPFHFSIMVELRGEKKEKRTLRDFDYCLTKVGVAGLVGGCLIRV